MNNIDKANKRMNKILLIVLLALSTGCDNDFIYPESYEKIVSLCENHGGVEKVYLSRIVLDKAHCNDGVIIKKQSQGEFNEK